MDLIEQALEAWAPLIESGYEVPAAGQVMRNAAAELRTLRAELERRKYDGVHTCHADCQREACVLRREVEALRAERDAEVAEIVAFVRSTAEISSNPSFAPVAGWIADAIERREYKEPKA